MTCYAELHCLSNLSFLRGVSGARELFGRAAELGYEALAITDECSVAGIVRALEAADASGIKLIVGTELSLEDGAKVVLLASDMPAYAALCQIITTARGRAAKGSYLARWDDLASGTTGLLALLVPTDRRGHVHPRATAWASELAKACPGRAWLALEIHRGDEDQRTLSDLLGLAADYGLRCLAAGDVHMHVRGRRALQDTVTAIRHGKTLAEAAGELYTNGERHLRPVDELARLYPPFLLEETVAVAARCSLDLRKLGYHHPHDVVPLGQDPKAWLAYLVERGTRHRWPGGVPPAIAAQIARELDLIGELGYGAFFLTVHDIVRFARSRGILCQGRGSAANSVVCYALGITEVDPEKGNLLFERFLSRERAEPPDIDVDFEHERREEVIQYIYGRYGKERAALAATLICYRPRSAVRDVAKALGFDASLVDRLARATGYGVSELPARWAEAGIDPSSPALQRLLVLVGQLVGTPRHLSQHVGGFVISSAPLTELVPVEPATMEGRWVIQWDKADLEEMGLLKIDVLALGMLSALRRTFSILRDQVGVDLSLAVIPPEDPATYAMLRRADTVGVFQVESRAQMSMLPRLRPTCFYDLVVSTAIIRPGPIQGGMVHPYLRRRQGKEVATYPSPEVRGVLERTLGVPIFQEQVMQLAVVAAGFTPGEADQLRRSMGAWERHGALDHFRTRLLEGMAERGYEPAFAEQVFQMIRGFGAYGFPESHAASFALLAYASAWLRCHHPAAFLTALLNAQPLGFYTPDQLLQDARRHSIEVRPPDARVSGWDCHLEGQGIGPLAPGDVCARPAIRLGLRVIAGLRRESVARMVVARRDAPFKDVADMAQRAALDQRDLPLLADAGALEHLAGHRHVARWVATGIEATLPLFGTTGEPPATIRAPTAEESLAADFGSMGLSTQGHPMVLLRSNLERAGALTLAEAARLPHGRRARVAALIGLRQQPPAAKGTCFLTLEDESQWLSAVLWPDVADRCRVILRTERFIIADGQIEHVDGVTHLIVAMIQPARKYTSA